MFKVLIFIYIFCANLNATESVCGLFYDSLLSRYLEDRKNLLEELNNQFEEENPTWVQLMSKEDILDDYLFSFYEFNQNTIKSSAWNVIRYKFLSYVENEFISYGFKKKENLQNEESQFLIHKENDPKFLKAKLLEGIEVNNSMSIKGARFTPEVLEQVEQIFKKSKVEATKFLVQTIKNSKKIVNSSEGTAGIKPLKKISGSGDYKTMKAYEYEVKYFGQFGKYRILGNVHNQIITFEIIVEK